MTHSCKSQQKGPVVCLVVLHSHILLVHQQVAVPVLKGTGANTHLTRLGKTGLLSASRMQSRQAGRADVAQGLLRTGRVS